MPCTLAKDNRTTGVLALGSPSRAITASKVISSSPPASPAVRCGLANARARMSGGRKPSRGADMAGMRFFVENICVITERSSTAPSHQYG